MAYTINHPVAVKVARTVILVRTQLFVVTLVIIEVKAVLSPILNVVGRVGQLPRVWLRQCQPKRTALGYALVLSTAAQ